ncbi:acyltransferase family protein [Lactobacillus amylovorus]|uniref:acyltransferase family protein n=1 Tax=Lactobacillus amylovorus TaxID=1604 RepID=UPI003F889536
MVFSWLVLYSLASLIVKHKFNFLNEIEGSMFTGVNDSHFYHFWFFWALIIMLLIAPILLWLLQQGFKYFLVLTIMMTIICLIQDLSLHMGYTYLMRDTQQVFRLNTWLEYYLLGGLIGNSHFSHIKEFVKTHFLTFSILDIFLYVILIIYSLWNRQIIGWVYAEANYNNILVMLISVISMTLFATSQPKVENITEYIIPATMGIYILQSFVIGYLGKIAFFHMYPALLIPIVFIICLFMVKVALKIPVINRLFKL